ncbi:MAG: hypothetical protein LBO72_08660 [Helicobacteraceae bacterium]|jgi:hypothetical protein|nr:hypothetical protein [Helicobacteraceae bacterium]
MTEKSELLLVILNRLEILQNAIDELRAASQNEYLSVKEAAKRAQMSPAGVMWRLERDPNVTPDDWRKIDGRYYIRRSSLNKFYKKAVK